MKKLSLYLSLFCFITIILNACNNTIPRKQPLSELILGVETATFQAPNRQNDLNDRFTNSFNDFAEWQNIAESKINSTSSVVVQLYKNQLGFKEVIEKNQESILANKTSIKNTNDQLANIQQQIAEEKKRLNGFVSAGMDNENQTLILANKESIQNINNQLNDLTTTLEENQSLDQIDINQLADVKEKIDTLEKNAKIRNEVIDGIMRREKAKIELNKKQ